MLIGIDANEANLTPDRVGINEYAFHLLWAIRRHKTAHAFVIYLKNTPRADLPTEGNNWHYRVIPFSRLWTQTRLPLDLFGHRPRPDVFFSLTHYAPRWSPVPTVVAIMDVGFLDTPEQFTAKDFNQLKSWTQYSVRQARKIIAISEYTKQHVVRVYHRDPADVVVTPLAYDAQSFRPVVDPAILEKHGVRQPYVLFLSSLKPNKNVPGLIRAFAQLRSPAELALVVSGKKAWQYEQIFSLVHDFGLEDKVVFTGFVPDADKPALMSQAVAFVMPSLHEGFGIPVLEAMACGVPVVISRAASLPEVGGMAAIYVDPASADSIASGIRLALGPHRQQYVKRGLNRVKLFSWANTARQTLAVLESARR